MLKADEDAQKKEKNSEHQKPHRRLIVIQHASIIQHASNRATTLTVLRYMKESKPQPSEVMYTSLIAFAGRMVKQSRSSKIHDNSRDSSD